MVYVGVCTWTCAIAAIAQGITEAYMTFRDFPLSIEYLVRTAANDRRVFMVMTDLDDAVAFSLVLPLAGAGVIVGIAATRRGSAAGLLGRSALCGFLTGAVLVFSGILVEELRGGWYAWPVVLGLVCFLAAPGICLLALGRRTKRLGC